jgi:hypothetical protein
MIEPPCAVVDGSCAIDCSLYLCSISYLSLDDRYRIAELLMCLFSVACEYAHSLLAFD